MNLSQFNSVLRQVFLLPVVALLVLAGALYMQIRGANLTVDLIQDSDARISQATLVSKLIVDEESGLRGYETTGDSRFLQPFNEAQPQIEEDIQGLSDMAEANSKQRQDVADLRSAHQTWRDGFARPIVATVRGGGKTDDVVLNLQGKALMDQVRHDLDDIIHQAEDNRVRRIAQWNRQVRIMLTVLLSLALGMGLLIGFFTRNRLHAVSAAYRSSLEILGRRAEELFQSEQELRTTLESIGDGVITCDAEGRVQMMNPVARDLTGWNQSEAKGQPLDNAALSASRLVCRAISSITPMMSDIRLEVCSIRAMASTALATTCPLYLVLSRALPADAFACWAFSAVLLTTAEISSNEADVSSRVAACSLARSRQIRGTRRYLGRRARHLSRQFRQHLDRLSQALYRGIEFLFDLLVGLRKIVGQAERQVAGGQLAEPDFERPDDLRLLLRASALLVHAAALLFRRLRLCFLVAPPLLRGLALETLPGERPVPEHAHRSRHLADLVPILGRRHVEAGIAGRQAAHRIANGVQAAQQISLDVEYRDRAGGQQAEHGDDDQHDAVVIELVAQLPDAPLHSALALAHQIRHRLIELALNLRVLLDRLVGAQRGGELLPAQGRDAFVATAKRQKVGDGLPGLLVVNGLGQLDERIRRRL